MDMGGNVVKVSIVVDTTDKDMQPVDETLVKQGLAQLAAICDTLWGGHVIEVCLAYSTAGEEKRYIVTSTFDETLYKTEHIRPLSRAIAIVRDLLRQSGIYLTIESMPGLVCTV